MSEPTKPDVYEKAKRIGGRLVRFADLKGPVAVIRNEADILLAATGKPRLKPSAVGKILLVAPHPDGSAWAVFSFSESGRFCSAAIGFKTSTEACAHRRALLRHHKQLAADRKARALKRWEKRRARSAPAPN